MNVKKSFHQIVMSLALCGAIIISAPIAQANQIPSKLATDSRMRIIPYDENNVVTVVGNKMVLTEIDFSPTEVINGVEFGNSLAWETIINKPHPNMLFFKPRISVPIDTNLTVITTKHTYHFRVMANQVNSKASPTYSIRFTYPQEEMELALADAMKQEQKENAMASPHPTDPFDWNWNYAYSACCSRDNVPIKAFDDGEFTYFQFSPHAEIPSIFVVDGQGHESLAATTMKGPYVVVQTVARQFTFRNGKDSASCIFNEHYSA